LGTTGGPFEFNLRDLLRWLAIMHEHCERDACVFIDTIYMQRMRCNTDKQLVICFYFNLHYFVQIAQMCEQVFNTKPFSPCFANAVFDISTTSSHISLGRAVYEWNNNSKLQHNDDTIAVQSTTNLLLHSQMSIIESLLLSVRMSWPVLLVCFCCLISLFFSFAGWIKRCW
jgi:midasin (ATPase involved in ribosome maturation)